MGIIVKFILKNIMEKKFRTFLILISIVISSALFFSSNAITNSVGKMFVQRVLSYYGNSDIVIQPGNDSPSTFFFHDGVEKSKVKTDYSISLVQGSASYIYNSNETINFSLVGINLKEYEKMNTIDIGQNPESFNFSGKKVIIGKSTADRYGLKTGSTIQLEIKGVKSMFTVAAIAKQSGLFMNDGISKFIAVPKDEALSIFGEKGKANLICIKLKDSGSIKQAISQISKEYPKYTVKEPYTDEELQSLTGGMTTGLLIMAIMIAAISIFIIYTSFKVVTMERLPVIGTFRSIGATKRKTNLVMLIESAIYGIVGGILGCILGIGVLYLLTSITGGDMIAASSTVPGGSGSGTVISFTTEQMITAFAFALILSLISCLIPIMKISKVPLKDVVLNTIESREKKGRVRLFIGLLLIAISFIGPVIFPKDIASFADILCLVFIIVATIMLVPYVTKAASLILEKVYSRIFGNVGILAAKNLRGNKSIINNICLLAVGISAIILMNTAGQSEVAMLTKLYKSANFDVWVTSMPNTDTKVINSINKMDGVTGVYPIYKVSKTEVLNKNGKTITSIDGVDSSKLSEYWDFDYIGNNKNLLTDLDKGRNIILANPLKKVLKVKEGDIITLKLPAGYKEYKVIGFVNTTMSDGSYGLISENYLKEDAKLSLYSNIFIKSSKNPDSLKQDILNNFSSQRPSLKTIKQAEKDDRDALGNTFTILNGISLLTLIIGAFGVFNNLIISFIERKRSLGMLKSIGMSKKQTVKMILVEAFSGGLIGGITGILAGLAMVWCMPYVMEAIDMIIDVKYPSFVLIAYILLGIAIFIAASVSPAIKSSKLSIINSVKYE